MRRCFRLTPEVRADLQANLLDVATDRPDAAERLLSEFYEALQRLGRSPGIGHFHEELLDRRFRVERTLVPIQTGLTGIL